MSRIRLDKLLVKRKIANDEQSAVEIILSGSILVNGAIQNSPMSFVDAGSAVEFMKEKSKYVSRGGLKLEKALNEFHVSPKKKRCLDVGASTGGFTDCLLQNGASQVVSIDVGHGQLDLSLRNDERVVVFEKTNAKQLNIELINGTCALAVVDVSFTSVIPLMDSISSCLEPIEIIILIKPQFEVEQKQINSKGIVANPSAHVECITKIQESLKKELIIESLTYSPLKGAKGNIEYLCHIVSSRSGEISVSPDRIDEVVNQAFSELKDIDD